MVEVAEVDEEPPKKKGGKMGLILGLVGAIAAGGGGFYVTSTGMVALPIGGGESHEQEAASAAIAALPNVAFIPLDPIIVSLSARAASRHLTFSSQLEITPESEGEVVLLLPRVIDVLNTYLRAVEERDIENPAAMTRLRAQMLRRVQMVVGEGRVRDLLITEFILN